MRISPMMMLFGFAIPCMGMAKPTEKPNVLLLSVDDMRDFVGFLDGYPGEVYTPNMDRLASMGIAFTNAHIACPLSCPSRNATMTGRYPSTTGLYDNNQWMKAVYPDMPTIPSYFKQNGYYTACAGKIFHHTPGNNAPSNWSDWEKCQDIVFDDTWQTADFTPEKFWQYGYRGPIPQKPDWKPLNQIKGLPNPMDWGPIPGKPAEEYGDIAVTEYAKKFLSCKHESPFFLALGTFKPHIPWHVAKKYFDMYPLDEIVLPERLDNDLDDVPAGGRKLALDNDNYQVIRDAGKLKEAVQAYLACITFVDEQIGEILDALESSPYAKNTIVVFWSDHGWHFGEKDHWHKRTLWEECTRIPFVVYDPSNKNNGKECNASVDMTAMFPTLISLCGLPELEGLDGVDISQLIRHPESKWNTPARTVFKKGNIAIRSDRWRYIRYADGGEELYDHSKDPHEWHNLANDPACQQIKQELGKWVPAEFHKPVAGKNTFLFDPYAFTFLNKETGAFIDGNK